MVSIWTVALLLLGAAKGNEVCHDSIRYVSDSEPWAGTAIRPLKILPWSPEKIGTHFLLYTNKNPNNKHGTLLCVSRILLSSDPSTIEASSFQIAKKTRFIIHGFIDKGDESWLVHMCKNMFEVEEVTCICAANNVRMVGAQTAQMLAMLKSNHSYSPSQVHLIGHSLGAHAAGEAGRKTPGLGRITGETRGPGPQVLSPVAPGHADTLLLLPFSLQTWEGNSQLCPWHTIPNCVHGKPVCTRTSSFTSPGTRDFVVCNHLRKSILNPSGFTAYSCACYRTLRCPADGMLYSSKFAVSWRYGLSITLSGRTATGQIKVALFGNKGNTCQYNVFNGIIKPGSTLSSELDGDIDVGTIEKVKFLWNNNVANPTLPKVGAAKIAVQKGEEKTEEAHSFCSETVPCHDTVREDVLLTLMPC
uniref:Triacylglycerol lipase n=1 Tax=Capra hircus TaxID=9925 RepID=A0A452DMJ9_CAPHI